MKWTVTHKTEDLTGIQLTDNAGKTGYWDTGANQAVTGITPSKGYGSVTYHVAVELVGGGSMTLQQALTSYYLANIGEAEHLYLYVRVTNGTQARIANAAANVYAAGAEAHTSDTDAVTFQFELSSTGATTSWDVSGTLYASIKATTTDEGAYTASSAAALYANATINATVGTATAAFDPFA